MQFLHALILTTDTLLATSLVLFSVLSFNWDWREDGTSSVISPCVSTEFLNLDLTVLHSLTTYHILVFPVTLLLPMSYTPDLLNILQIPWLARLFHVFLIFVPTVLCAYNALLLPMSIYLSFKDSIYSYTKSRQWSPAALIVASCSNLAIPITNCVDFSLHLLYCIWSGYSLNCELMFILTSSSSS